MSTSNISLILPLVDAQRSQKTGSKAANLSKLIAARFAVPKGFVISADAYRAHLWASGARDVASASADVEDREKIRNAILSTQMPEDISQAIAEAYKWFSYQIGFSEPRVILRPSALEGQSEAGFPGAYESYMNVTGLDALIAAVKRIWASLWNGKAAAYRITQDIDAEPAMAVIVQQMVDAQWCGTMLTADPVTGNPDTVLISCNRPHSQSEPITANSMRAPRYKVNLHDLSRIGCDDERDEGLSDADISLLAEKAVFIEEVYSEKVETEWAYENGMLWFLQAKPLPDIPKYFPVSWPDDSYAGSAWRCIARKSVSWFSRSLLFSAPRGGACGFSGMDNELKNILINGRVYQSALSDTNQYMRTLSKDLNTSQRLLAQWKHDIEPDLRARAGKIISAKLNQMDYQHLLNTLSEAVDITRYAADWLDISVYPSAVFPDLLKRMLQDKSDSESLYWALIGGLDDPTLLRDAKLQELGERFAIADEAGRTTNREWWLGYRNDVEAFARDYGYSFKTPQEMCDFSLWESWIEDTDTVFRMIAALSRHTDRPTLVTLHHASQQLAASSADKAAQMYKGAEKNQFCKLLEASREWLATRNSTEHVFALSAAALRIVLLELADRLCDAHVLSELHDIFNLSLDDIMSLPEDLQNTDRTGIATAIARRRHEMWLENRLAAPIVIFSNENQPKEDNLADNFNTGSASGCARVARNIVDASEIETGDVLVVESVSLAWTPLLAVAEALVSESSYASLSAISLARGYNAALAIGCKDAMKRIKTGQRVSISPDGSTGM